MRDCFVSLDPKVNMLLLLLLLQNEIDRVPRLDDNNMMGK